MTHDIPSHRSGDAGIADAVATGLGWFSLGLGAVELLAPHRVTRPLGMEGQEALVRGYGLRELATGAGILASSGRSRAPWMWSRVAGDLLDIGTVAARFDDARAPRRNLDTAVAALAGVTLIDAWCAGRLSRARPRLPRQSELNAGRRPRRDGYVAYSDDLETIDPDEDRIIERIIEVMAAGGERVRQREGRALRTSHAKPHGLLRGELHVESGLPPELRQGLFAAPGTYPVAVRLAQVPGEPLDDRRVSTPRGMAIKVMDVPGEKLPPHAGESTQDFVLDTGKAFISATARSFLAAITATEAATPLPEAAKSAVSGASRATNAALNAVGLDSAKLDFYGHPPRHPLAEAYYSQAPLRYGAYVAKLAVFPDMPELRRLAERDLVLEDENGVRDAVDRYLRDTPAEFAVCVQLCTDPERMPIEDASVVWPEEESAYRRVARLVLPPQPATDAAREREIDEDMAFCPSHGLAAHRPLGSIMRARMRAYEELGRKRRELNARPAREPRQDETAPTG